MPPTAPPHLTVEVTGSNRLVRLILSEMVVLFIASLSSDPLYPMVNNVRPFRPRQPEASPKARLFSVAFALGIGWLLYSTGLQEGNFNLFVLLGILYWVFIRRHAIETSYFTRNHYLHTTMGQLFIFICGLLVITLVSTLNSLLGVLPLPGLATTLLALANSTQLAYQVLSALLAIILAVHGLQGKTTRIPVISASAEYWA